MSASDKQMKLKALILVGGFGTRLRPLTLSKPKPLVPFANKPIVEHQIAALAKVGVKHIIMAVSYQPQIMDDYTKQFEKEYNVKITISKEDEPLGTAGPLALAKQQIVGPNGDDCDAIFVLNSDVTCSYPLEQILKFHMKHGKEGTISVTKVTDPSKYGVVVTDETGRIERFVEKPQIYVGNRINAGIYCFNPKILNRIPLKPTSIEREIFPVMADAKELYAIDLEGFWMDIGQPKDYLAGIPMYLNHLKSIKSDELTTNTLTEEKKAKLDYKIAGDTVIISPKAKIGTGCIIGPNVTIGDGVVIGNHTRLTNCAILEDCKVGSHTWVDKTIIGWNSSVGDWCRTQGVTVLGEDVQIASETFLNGAIILPHKSVKDNIYQPEIIM